jgi:hypothetical protein
MIARVPARQFRVGCTTVFPFQLLRAGRKIFTMPASETPAHRYLKRLALAWAAQRGFCIAATEVSVPRLGFCRLDVAAYRPQSGVSRGEGVATGTLAIFECKQSRADFLRDTRCETETLARLETLNARLATYEGFLRAHHPTLRAGEELFPEFDSYRFEMLGYEPYDRLREEIAALTRRLHSCTKFSRLARWRAANLHYVVAEPEVARASELPAGWGLLIRRENALETVAPATWCEISGVNCWNVVLRIAKSATRELVRSLENQITPSAAGPSAEAAALH